MTGEAALCRQGRGVMRASATVASIFARLRTMPASCISASFFFSLQRAIFFRIEAANALRKASRLRRMVIQESPAWKPSSTSFSNIPVVVFRHAPFLVVIGDVERIGARPRTSQQAVGAAGCGDGARRLLFLGHSRVLLSPASIARVVLARRAAAFKRAPGGDLTASANLANRFRPFIGELKDLGMTFRAVRADKTDAGQTVRFVDMEDAHLMEGDVTIRVTHSTVNYKDGLALSGKSPIIRSFPMVLGVDLAGARRNVAAAGLRSRRRGDPDRPWPQRNPLRRLRRKSAGERRLVGQTAGGVDARRGDGDRHRGLHRHAGVDGDRTGGPRAVLGAGAGDRRGGGRRLDGDLAARGQGLDGRRLDRAARPRPAISSRWARPRSSTGRRSAPPGRPLGKERWAAAVDSVGSTTLANALAQTKYGGAVAACGLAGGMDLPATVAPFILRGVSLLGIESVHCPAPRRLEAWRRLAADLDRGKLAAMTETIPLDQVFDAGARIVKGETRGRLVVTIP